MVGLGISLAAFEFHDLVADHPGLSIRLGEGTFFQHLGGAVVTQPANVAAVGVDNAIEQREFGVTTIHHIEPVGLDRPLQDR